jgi:hypothetical protein
MTQIDYRLESRPKTLTDKFHEALGLRLWLRVQSRRALRRLAAAIETGSSVSQPIRAAAG